DRVGVLPEDRRGLRHRLVQVRRRIDGTNNEVLDLVDGERPGNSLTHVLREGLELRRRLVKAGGGLRRIDQDGNVKDSGPGHRSPLPSSLVPLRLLRPFLVDPQHRRYHFVVLVEPRTHGNLGGQTDLNDQSSPGSPVVGSTSVSGAVASTISASSMNDSNDPAYCPVRRSAAHDTNASQREGFSDNPPHGGFCRFPVVSNRM